MPIWSSRLSSDFSRHAVRPAIPSKRPCEYAGRRWRPRADPWPSPPLSLPRRPSFALAVANAPAGSLKARAEVSFVPDQPVLYDDLSVNEHIEFTARLHGEAEWPERADVLLEVLGLTARADDLPSRFSRGQESPSQ